jgi:hypothetical protein
MVESHPSGLPLRLPPIFWHLFHKEQRRDPRGGRMNNEAMKEVLNELFSHLERLETQSEAILQFLKEKKRVTDKRLAPYLEQLQIPAM